MKRFNAELTKYTKITDKLNRCLKSINEFQQSFKNMATNIFNFLQNIAETVEIADKAVHEFPLIMLQLGWPPHMGLCLSEIVDIVEFYYKNETEATKIRVESFLLSRYDNEEIDKIYLNWKKEEWLQKRMPILEQVILAHKEKKYYLSVAAILPQIEGMIADHYRHRGRINYKQFKKYISELFSNTSTFSFDEVIQQFLLNLILVEFEYGTFPRSSLSRHAILHGGDTNYGTAVNSLKCILLFDYIQHKCGNVALKNL